jgi:hypothetical protein
MWTITPTFNFYSLAQQVRDFPLCQVISCLDRGLASHHVENLRKRCFLIAGEIAASKFVKQVSNETTSIDTARCE